jgi:multiple sugar transport system substrate-binding protein
MNLKDHCTAPVGTANGCAETDFGDTSPNFEKGTIAIEPRDGAYIASLIQQHPKLDLGVALIPGKTPGYPSSFIGGDLVAIPASSQHPDDAWDLIQYVLSADVQVGAFAQAGYVPVRGDLVANPVTSGDSRFETFAEALDVGFVPSILNYTDLYEAWSQIIKQP